MELIHYHFSNFRKILLIKNRILSGLLLVISPWILLLIVTKLISHNCVFFSIPYWTDELSYWHEVLSFSSKGFNFGYYTINEIVPKILSFGTHGFGTISIYSLYAKIFGWNYYSIVIANNVFISLAFFFFVLIVKPTTEKTLLITSFYLTYSPIILYCSTSMSEMLNYAIIIIYFTLLYTYINSGVNKKNIVFFLFFLCVFISFIRIIYIVLFLPIILCRTKQFKLDRKTIYLLGGWILLSISLFLINSQFVSPFPVSFLSELFSVSNPLQFVLSFVKHFILNVLRFIYPFRDESIQIFQRYLILYLILWYFIKYRVRKFRYLFNDPRYLSGFIIIVLSLLITISAYDVFNWRDFRVMAPLIFGVFLLAILYDGLLIIKRLLLINLIGILLICFSPKIYNSFFFDSNRYTKPLTNIAFNRIRYNKNALSKFENTVVVDSYDANIFLYTDAGIGITYSDTLSDILKSKYIYTHSSQTLKTYHIIEASRGENLYQKNTNISVSTKRF